LRAALITVIATDVGVCSREFAVSRYPENRHRANDHLVADAVVVVGLIERMNDKNKVFFLSRQGILLQPSFIVGATTTVTTTITVTTITALESWRLAGLT
jgi:hypothetical protein